MVGIYNVTCGPRRATFGVCTVQRLHINLPILIGTYVCMI